jgi:hypothetical protein
VVLDEVIEANRSVFEKENADREGYGTGTMGQIVLELRELTTKG